MNTYPTQVQSPVWTGDWDAAASDIVRGRATYPGNDLTVAAITVAAISASPTQGTISFQAGMGAGGNTLLNASPADPFNLSTLTANSSAGSNNVTTMALVGGTTDLDGDLGHGITIEVTNSDQPIKVMIAFGPK